MQNLYAMHSFLRLPAPNLLTRLHEDPFLVSSTVPLMRLGDLDPDRRRAYFERALRILKNLDAAGRLEPRRKGSIAWLESRLGR